MNFIWAIASGKICLTAHVLIKEEIDCEAIMPLMRKVLAEKFGILHTTLLHERQNCTNEEVLCHFAE